MTADLKFQLTILHSRNNDASTYISSVVLCSKVIHKLFTNDIGIPKATEHI